MPKKKSTMASVVLRENTLRAQAARRGTFKLWTPSASAGSNIRQVRVEGTETLKRSMESGVWSPGSTIKVMEDLEWCKQHDLKPLYEMYDGDRDATGEFIGGIEEISGNVEDLKLHRFLIIDRMHRVTTWNQLRLLWDKEDHVEGEENPFNWIAAEHVWLYDQRALGTKLVNFVATRSNQDAGISVQMNWLDWMTTMRQFHVAYLETLDESDPSAKTFTAFSRWYTDNVDDSLAKATLRVYASQAVRLTDEAVEMLLAKFLPASVPQSIVGHTHQDIDRILQ